MADPRFHPPPRGPFRLDALARQTLARLRDDKDKARLLYGVAPLSQAGARDIAVLHNMRYRAAFAKSGAGACIVPEDSQLHGEAPSGMALLVSASPHLSYTLAARVFHPLSAGGEGDEAGEGEIASSAVVHAEAEIGRGCVIGALAVVEKGARLGDGCRVGPHAVIGAHVEIGEHSRIGAHAVISHAVLGKRVTVKPGARIGQPGFGFAPDGRGGFVETPQLGIVRIGDDCLIGANSTVDRGSLRDTVLADGCHIDNLVHIAHNVTLGRACVMAGQVGISGSVDIGDGCMFGGQVGIAGHLSIGAGAQLAAQSGVMRDVAAGAKLVGAPALPWRVFWRRETMLRKMIEARAEAKA